MGAPATAAGAGAAPDDTLARAADAVEARAWADWYAAAPAALRSRMGLQVRTMAGATLLMAPGWRSGLFNRAIGLGWSRPAGAQDLIELAAAYRQAGSPAWVLHWSPGAQPSTLPAEAAALGYGAPATRWAKMARPPLAPPAIRTELTVRPADDGCADELAQAIAGAFGMPEVAPGIRALHGRPRWHLVAATDGRRIVGGGALFVDGTDAWLGMGAILPDHRRRGGQGALMACRIADAVAAGASRIFTETGEPVGQEPNPSLANMRRCGFVQVASRLNLPGPAAPGRAAMSQ